MVDLSKQFELDKLERGQEWQLFSEAIEKANNEGMPDSLEGGSGLLTQEEGSIAQEDPKRTNENG